MSSDVTWIESGLEGGERTEGEGEKEGEEKSKIIKIQIQSDSRRSKE